MIGFSRRRGNGKDLTCYVFECACGNSEGLGDHSSELRGYMFVTDGMSNGVAGIVSRRTRGELIKKGYSLSKGNKSVPCVFKSQECEHGRELDFLRIRDMVFRKKYLGYKGRGSKTEELRL